MSPKRLLEPGIKSSVYLTARQREGLAVLSGRTLIPVTQLIRVAIDHLLAHPEGTIRTVQRERQPPQGRGGERAGGGDERDDADGSRSAAQAGGGGNVLFRDRAPA